MKKPPWLRVLESLDIAGRDDFHTHLIAQECPFWLKHVREGHNEIPKSEVDVLIKRRGFNKAEAKKFRNLAAFVGTHAKQIRATESPKSRVQRYLKGYGDGASARYADDTICPTYKRGYQDGKKVRKSAERDFLYAATFVDPQPAPASRRHVRKAHQDA
jgi:hypothetical protein